jgi:PHD/YefM family antitoxin component YafN of YafNO toxin-antitoxin module
MGQTTAMGSEEVRLSWRDTLDTVYLSENTVVVERYSKPVAVLIGYDHYRELRRAKGLLEADRQVAEVKAGDYVDLADIEAELSNADPM